ncbi:MAG TPA: response regulator transcription factor [Ktedonobacteraceae bacterium]
MYSEYEKPYLLYMRLLHYHFSFTLTFTIASVYTTLLQLTRIMKWYSCECLLYGSLKPLNPTIVEGEYMKMLIVEDDTAINDLIRMSLNAAGFTCTCVYDGLAAADMLETNSFDLVLLDIMLPNVDGYELLEYIRPLNIPVIFITAKSSVPDRVKGLNLGADDYIVKPFAITELTARIEAILRRYNKDQKVLIVDDLEINTESRLLSKQGKQVELTLKEYELLVMLVRNKNIALFRETLFERIWGSSFMGDTRTLDLHIQRLRKKLGWEDKIKTVYKIGYRLEV